MHPHLIDAPAHWERKKLKYACKFEYGSSLSSEDRIEGNICVFGSNGVVDYHNEAITNAPCIIIGRKGSFGKINWSNDECFPIDTTYFVDNTKTKESLRWMFYAFQTLNLDAFSKDTGVPGLSREDAYNRYMLLPPLPEQEKIANFLDEKTAQIDGLITKKTELIALLQEEEKAFINEKLTTNTENWQKKKLKYVVEMNPEVLSEKTAPDLSFRYIDIGSVNENGEVLSTQWMIFEEAPSRARRIVKKGYTIISTVRTYLKAIAYIESFDDMIIVSTGFAVLKPKNIIVDKFLFYSVRSEKFIDEVCANSVGVSYPAITSEELGNISIKVPILSIQEKIVSEIEIHIKKSRAIAEKLEKEVILLKEYRQSLISEAVTGKLSI